MTIMRWVAAAVVSAAMLAGCGHRGGVQVGIYPHCRYGVAHAQGLPPQCAMPEPVFAAGAR